MTSFYEIIKLRHRNDVTIFLFSSPPLSKILVAPLNVIITRQNCLAQNFSEQTTAWSLLWLKIKKYKDITKVKSNFKRVLAIVGFIFEIIGFSNPKKLSKGFRARINEFISQSFSSEFICNNRYTINLLFLPKTAPPFISPQYLYKPLRTSTKRLTPRAVASLGYPAPWGKKHSCAPHQKKNYRV